MAAKSRGLKSVGADFTFEQSGIGVIVVRFRADVVTVRYFGKVHRIDNRPRRWGGSPYKPCLTHAMDAARQALPKPQPPKTEHERQRRAAVEKRPLRVFKGK